MLLNHDKSPLPLIKRLGVLSAIVVTTCNQLNTPSHMLGQVMVSMYHACSPFCAQEASSKDRFETLNELSTD